MPKVDGQQTKGEIKSEELQALKKELSRQAFDLEHERDRLTEKLAADSLAEQLKALRQERAEEQVRELQERGEKLPAHRPASYTTEEGDALCEWITNGHSLSSWCRQTGRSAFVVYGWMRTQPDFARRYAQAHEDRTDTMADDLLEIADQTEGTDSIAAVQAAKLRIETRKWIASKLKPQKYGEKQLVETSGQVTFQLGVPNRTIDITPETRSIAGPSSDSQSDRRQKAG
jgi:hypothetical protein